MFKQDVALLLRSNSLETGMAAREIKTKRAGVLDAICTFAIEDL